MRVWLASFLLLFAIAEVYQWAKHFTLPLPIFILGGTFLAIVSNYDKYPEITKGRGISLQQYLSNIATQRQGDIATQRQGDIATQRQGDIATQRQGDRHL